MILSITSDIETFKSVRFRRGLNVLLADVAAISTEGHTRNSAGKSSLIEILHFLIGSDVSPLFKAPEIVAHWFSGVLRIQGRVVRITRRCGTPNRIFIDEKRARRLGLDLVQDDETGERYVPLDDWKSYLGHAWFNLPRRREGTQFEAKNSPTFRKLIGYFVRRSRDIGFAHPDRFVAQQAKSDSQIALSYLLGLDWQIPLAIRELKDRRETLTKIRKSVKDGDLGAMFGTSASIRPELTRVEERVGMLNRQSETFQVLDSYRELSDDAAAIRGEMSQLALDLSVAKDTLNYLEQMLTQEKPPAYAAVQTLYEAAKIELPGVALRRFEDMERFQASVVENRRTYLAGQADEMRGHIQEMNTQSQGLDERRAHILKTLQGKGAFEDLQRIHDELGQATSRAETLREKLKNANILEHKTTEMKKDSAELELRLQKDYEDRSEEISAATRLVDRAIAALYDDRTGNLLIEPNKSGPTFTLSIGGGGNQGGIDQMKVFCFDIMLFQRTTDRLGGTRFLVHDSHLFDGVDPRQARSALLLGSKLSSELNGQYIVTMNSDKYAKLGDRPELASAVVNTRLTDDEHGGLFGFRFDLVPSSKS
jgi:uncharacterized protein YydD (DUF2326 family)